MFLSWSLFVVVGGSSFAGGDGRFFAGGDDSAFAGRDSNAFAGGDSSSFGGVGNIGYALGCTTVRGWSTGNDSSTWHRNPMMNFWNSWHRPKEIKNSQVATEV